MTQTRDVQEMLGLQARPLAIAFLTEPPAGVSPWHGPAQPAGCAFWRQAQDGESSYTVPADHFNCAVGAYTHAIDLPPERAEELNQTLGLMVDNGYIEMAEVPGIPRPGPAPGGRGLWSRRVARLPTPGSAADGEPGSSDADL